MAEMKMAGIEYDERMEELEKLEYPKPNREFVYSTFNAFADKHPWVGQENIRPKSIAREMFESFRSFSDYIRDYELQRAEGVLLRHLNSVYKVLAPNRARHRQERRRAGNGTLPGHHDPPGRFQPARRMGEDARPELPARRDQRSAPARRRGSRRRHHPRHQGLHRRHPQPHLHLPARPGERRFRAGPRPSLLAAGPRRPALDRRAASSRRWTPTTPSTSASAWTRTPATSATPTCSPPKTSAPGASSRCWWTRRSTTTGWRSSKWTSPAPAKPRSPCCAW